jgi:hypothetical protein
VRTVTTKDERMRKSFARRLSAALGAALLAGVLVAATAQTIPQSSAEKVDRTRVPQRPLATGVVDTFSGDESDLAFRRTVQTGAKYVRLPLIWREVAPRVREPGFRPEDPADPAYQWDSTDQQVVNAVRQGLAPMIEIHSAPQWAEGAGEGRPGTVRPDPAEFAKFATAVARRYSGTFQGLPRVRYWQAWNEPNLIFYLMPQYVQNRPVSPGWYRSMGNAFSAAVHGVHGDNIVVAGGLAPFTTFTGDFSSWGLGPLAFMREMLCLSKELKPTCRTQARFDVWSHHPYTSGGPTHHAKLPDDVSIPDLPEMSRLLKAAIRQGHVVSEHRVQFWVTEFSWDTSPPDPKGVPALIHARWVAEALYRMWTAGVSVVMWFKLRDDPFPSSFIQSGLYFRGANLQRDRPKPALRAFRFPFVALPSRNRALVWGRTSTSTAGPVVLQVKVGARWLPFKRLSANRFGIFESRIRVRRGASVRAHFSPERETSLPFRVVKTKDRPMYAFGTIPR